MMKWWGDGDGTLTWTQFRAACIGFAERWNNMNSLPPWIWTPAPKHRLLPNRDDGYLSMENMCIVKSCEGSFHEIEEEEEQVGCFDEDESVDPATLQVQGSRDNVHYYDFHIVYSSSYRVPVLYFRVYHSDGQSVPWGELEKDLPPESAETLVKLKWTFITQEEHPYLNRPWYKLHPCGTGEWIKLLLDGELTPARKEKSPELYLVSWLSVVGQVVGLKLPYEILNREKDM